MRTTIDAAGRIVVPKRLRDSLGLIGGSQVDIEEHGGVIQIRAAGGHARLERVNGRLVAVGSGAVITDELINSIRDADRK